MHEVLFFGSAFLVSIVVFYGATLEGFERWRQRTVDRYDRSKLAKRAASGFARHKKNERKER